MFPWEAALNDERNLCSGEVAADADDELNVKQEICDTKGHRTENEDGIHREVVHTLKELITKESSNTVEESLSDILRTSLHKAQGSI